MTDSDAPQTPEEAVAIWDWEACIAFGALAVPALIAALRADRARVRGEAAFTLGQIGDRRAIEPLIGALYESEHFVSRSAAEALARLDQLETLLLALIAPDAVIRAAAAYGLGRAWKREAIPALTAALNDADAEVRRQAARALALMQ